MENEKAKQLAREALRDLLEGTAITSPLVKASTVAALRGDVVQRAWFQFQTADLKNVDPGQISDDFFRLRRNIDVVPDRVEQRRILVRAKDAFLDSRGRPDNPEVIFDAPVSKLDELLGQLEQLESSADGREMEDDLVDKASFLKLIRQRITQYTEHYLRSVVA